MSRQQNRDILRLFTLTIGVLLMTILLSGCQPTQVPTDNTPTRDSIVQIQNSSDSILVKVTISAKIVNDTVIDGRYYERFYHLTIRDTV